MVVRPAAGLGLVLVARQRTGAVDERGEDRVGRPQVGEPVGGRHYADALGSTETASPSRAFSARSTDAAMHVNVGVSCLV